MQNLLWAGLFIALTLLGCSDRHDATPLSRTHVARTGGSAVALSADERVAVVCNRSAGVVSVVALDPTPDGITRPQTIAEFDTGEGSEPWASVVGVDDDTAYVLLRSSQMVRRITSLHGSPQLDVASVSVGSEPTAIAITPSGRQLFVANWGEGTISILTTADFVHQADSDLNRALVDTGALGAIEPRPALAHPRALAVTDDGDGDDSDETLYATEFFSQPLIGVQATADLSQVDRNRQGFVYPVSLRSGQPGAPISIAPVQATGFEDSEGNMTGCFPNQLYAAAVDHARLYVTSMCASPRGPVGPTTIKTKLPTDKNFKTLVHPAVFVIDTTTNSEVPSAGRLLTQVLDQYYQNGEDPANERMPLIPDDITFGGLSETGSSAFVSAMGADALFRLDYDRSGVLTTIGAPEHRFIDVLAEHGSPIGVAVSRTTPRPFALAVSDVKQRLSVIDLQTEKVDRNELNPDYRDSTRVVDPPDSHENRGRGFFATGLDKWSYKGQAWSSCESCHPGGLSDGVTWFFTRGPRRTLSVANTYEKSAEVAQRGRRLMLWGANIDELHDVETIVRNVSGGIGAEVWTYALPDANTECRLLYDGSAVPEGSGKDPCFGQKPTTSLQNGLNGSLASMDVLVRTNDNTCQLSDATCDYDSLPDWYDIDSFVRSLRAPHAPTQLSAGDVVAGRVLFEAGGCPGCHGGLGWTVSKLFYQPGADWNGQLPYKRPESGTLRLGSLRERSFSVEDDMLPLNPAAARGGGSATFRKAPPTDATEAEVIEYAYTGGIAGRGITGNVNDDQVRCALRDVGTFPLQPTKGVNNTGIAPPGAPGVFEYRQDMAALAQGDAGFNVPSLLGLGVGAPYFHAGNARTLEELFDSETFARHHQALAAGFLSGAKRATQVAQLVAFLLSIDEQTALESEPAEAALRHDFCH